MRYPLAALAVSVCLWALAALRAAHADAGAAPAPTQQPAATGQPASAPAASVSASASASAATGDPTGNSADAIRHAKRTACRKDARAKKLFGAAKTAYIKDCVAAP
jgi:hypothetical protein